MQGGGGWLSLAFSGIFIVVKIIEERRGVNNMGSSNWREIHGFNDFIEGLEVMDLPLCRKYTCNRTNETIKSRLHRALVSKAWDNHWLGGRVYALDRTNHCALILRPIQIGKSLV